MSFTLYHLLLATLAALMLSGCTSPGGATNWGPFQRRTDTVDTIPLGTGPLGSGMGSLGGGAAPAPQTNSSSNSWLPSWPSSQPATNSPSKGPNGSSQSKVDANPNLEAYQLSVGSRLAKGRELERGGQFDRARTIYLDLIKQYPQAAEPYHRIGIVADKQHRYREAQENFIHSLQIDPRNVNVRVDLGYCFYMQGQIAQAEAETRAALQLAPRDERAHNNLGLILGAQDRMAEAFEHFRLGGSEADAQFNMAFVYTSRNNLPAAKECFQRALDIDPHHEKARKALDSFVTYENQPDEIRTAMESSFEAERRGTIPFVEPGTVLKASAEGDASSDASAPATRSSVVPAGIPNSPSVSTPRNASKAVHSLYNEARAMKPLTSRGE